MNETFSIHNPQSAIRNRTAFTLVELLVVITIIGLLAALVIGGAGYATVYSHKVRVQSEMQALGTAINQYKAHKGFYPPDNTNNPASSTLFYELTGAIPTNSVGNGAFLAVTGEILKTNDMLTLFGTTGIMNSSADPTQPPENFFGTAGKSARTGTFTIMTDAPSTYTLFGVPVAPHAPAATFGTQVIGAPITPWSYVSSNPTNNSSEFDLWMDVVWHQKTNRISNWAADPQPLN